MKTVLQLLVDKLKAENGSSATAVSVTIILQTTRIYSVVRNC